MKTSVFSTSLTALDLREAIRVAAEVGYEAMEVGCFAPHLTLEMAEARGDEVRAWLRDAGLPVSALSLDVSYTDEDEDSWRANVDETCRFIELCERFGTRLMKIMPGPPGHAEATDGHWARFGDSIQSTARCLECGPSEVLGVNLDFCNVRTCGDDPLDALERFQDRLYLTHVKDSRFDLASGEYVPMGEGEMDYPPLIERLREVGYDRDLSVECLYPWAKRDDPRAAVSHDLAALRGLLVEGRA
jgi:inosose dehydratase